LQQKARRERPSRRRQRPALRRRRRRALGTGAACHAARLHTKAAHRAGSAEGRQ